MARKTIKQRIALDGGKQIKKEFEELGAAGAKAFKLLQKAADDLKGPSNAFLKSLDDAQKKLARVGKQFKSTGDTIQRAGRSFSTRITLPLVGAGTAITKVAGDFEAAMNRVGAASKAGAAQINEAREQALRLGEDTPFSAQQAADAMEVLVKNGLDMTQVLGGATDASLALAGATGSDLSGAADVATDVLQSFNKTVAELKPAADQITGTLLQSKLGFDDYRLALGQAGGVAGGLGVEFEDFNAVLAATSNLFTSGSDAGTSFKTFLTRLTPQSDQAAAVIEKFGLRFFDAAGNMRSMAEISDELRDKLGKLSDQDLTDVLKKIFGVDALRTAIGLMRQGSDGIERLRAAIATGNAEEQAAARLKGFNGELTKLSAAFVTLAVRIGDSGLLETMTDIVKGVSDFIKELSTSSPETLKFATEIAAVTAAIGPALIGLGLMTKGVGALLSPIRLAINGFVLLAGKIGLFRAALLSSGIGAAITLIGAGIVYWATRTDTATAAMEAHEKVVGRVEDAYRKAGYEVAKMAQEVRDRLTLETGDSLKKTTKALDEALANARASLFQFDGALGESAGELKKLKKDFEAGTLGVEDFQKQVLAVSRANPELGPIALEFVRLTDKAAKLSKTFREDTDYLALLKGEMSDAAYQSKNFTEEQRALAAAQREASNRTKETTQAVKELGKTITVHSSDGGKPVEKVYGLVDGVAEATRKSTDNLDKLSKKASDASKKIADAKEVATALLVSVPEELKNQKSPAAVLTEGLDGAKEQLKQTLSTIPTEAKTAVDGLITEVGRVQPAVQAALGGGAQAGAQAAGQATAVSGIADSLAKPFEDARDRIAEALTSVPPAVTNAIAAIQTSTSEFGATLGLSLVAPFQVAGDRIAEILDRMVSVVRDRFDEMLTSVRSLTTQLRAAVSQLESLAARAEAAASRAASANAGAQGRAIGGQVLRLAGGGQASGARRASGKVSGPGTGTSDSILSWLSNGEFVMRFAAVKKYGLDLLYAMNGLRLPKDFLKGFAGGGLVDFSGIVRGLTEGMRVPRMIPAMAEGGVASGSGDLRSLILQIGGQSFQAFVPEDVAEDLIKYDSRQGLSSAGKKPGWS